MLPENEKTDTQFTSTGLYGDEPDCSPNSSESTISNEECKDEISQRWTNEECSERGHGWGAPAPGATLCPSAYFDSIMMAAAAIDHE